MPKVQAADTGSWPHRETASSVRRLFAVPHRANRTGFVSQCDRDKRDSRPRAECLDIFPRSSLLWIVLLLFQSPIHIGVRSCISSANASAKPIGNRLNHDRFIVVQFRLVLRRQFFSTNSGRDYKSTDVVFASTIDRCDIVRQRSKVLLALDVPIVVASNENGRVRVDRDSSVYNTMSSPSLAAGQNAWTAFAVSEPFAMISSKIALASSYSSFACSPTTASSKIFGYFPLSSQVMKKGDQSI